MKIFNIKKSRLTTLWSADSHEYTFKFYFAFTGNCFSLFAGRFLLCLFLHCCNYFHFLSL